MRELLIKIRAILEGAGLREAAQGQREVAAATKEATRAAEAQARTTTTQATPADTAAAKAKEAVAGASSKAAGTFEQLRRAGGPATQIMQGLSQASAGGAQAISGLANVLKGSLAAALAPLGVGGAVAIGAATVAGLVAWFEKTRKPAEDAAEGIKKVADTAKELEQANLDTLSAGFARLNTEADSAKARLLAALDLSKQLADAETAAQIAFTKAQVIAGQISKEQGDEAIRGFGLAKQLRDTQDPARRAAIEADFAAQSAEQSRAQEAAVEAKLSEALALANFFESETKRLNALIASLEARQVGLRTGGPEVPAEVRAERLRVADEILKAEQDRAKVEANQAAQQARLEPINDELIKAVEARAEAERKAAEAAASAAAVQANANKIGALQTGTAQAEQTAARVASANAGASAQAQADADAAAAAAQARAQQRIQSVVDAEQRRRAQRDREIDEEVQARQTAPLPAFQLPAEASRPGSGFDVAEFNRQQAARFRSGADLREAEAARRAEFDRQRAAAEERAKATPSSASDLPSPGGSRPDTSLGGSRAGRAPAADGGTIEIGGRRFEAPAQTPVRDRPVPETPLRESQPGSIDVRRADGSAVQIDTASTTAIGEAVAKALVAQARMIA